MFFVRVQANCLTSLVRRSRVRKSSGKVYIKRGHVVIAVISKPSYTGNTRKYLVRLYAPHTHKNAYSTVQFNKAHNLEFLRQNVSYWNVKPGYKKPSHWQIQRVLVAMRIYRKNIVSLWHFCLQKGLQS